LPLQRLEEEEKEEELFMRVLELEECFAEVFGGGPWLEEEKLDRWR
jgi:hypothetical protein